MNIESFFTLQSLITGPSASTGKTVDTAINAAPLSDDGKNFVDIILDYMKAYGAAKDEQIEKEKDLAREEKLLGQSEEQKLLEKQKLSEEKKIEEEQLLIIKEMLAQLDKEQFFIKENLALNDAVELNQKAFESGFSEEDLVQKAITSEKLQDIPVLKFLSEAIFVDTKPSHKPAVFNDVKVVFEKIQRFAERNPAQLIAANLTPEQLTEIESYLVAIEQGEIPEEQPEIEAFIGLVKILPPPVRAEVFATSQNAPIAQQLLQQPLKLNNMSDIDTYLNALSSSDSDGDGAFEIVLRDLQASTTSQLKEKISYRANAAVANDVATQNPANANGPAPSLMVGTGEFTSLLTDPDNPVAAQTGLSAASVNPASASHAANPVVQSYSAGTTHPATQIVTNALQKTAQNGQNTEITLRLDPPELGRIQARLQFGTSNALQSLLTVEQPETFAMLQRDSHSLERALQDMGLDIGEGVNLELAEQGFNFDQNTNQRGGGHDSGGIGAGGEVEQPLDITESTMTWQIDPETGHTRYNIWA